MHSHTTEGLIALVIEYGAACGVHDFEKMKTRADAIRSYATALCQQGELLRQAREFIDTVHDGEYGYSECTRDELVEKIDEALSTSEGRTE